MLPLGYSTNLHAAETCAEIAAAMSGFAGALRDDLGWDRLGVDLRLGSVALAEGVAGWRLIRAQLDRHRLSAHTLNGFPLNPFQAARVKDAAYLPDWTSQQRYADSLKLLDAALFLSDEPLVTVSTVPGSYRPHHRQDAGSVATIAAALGGWAAAAASVKQSSGRTAVLCLEPEPWCLLENDHDVAWFWSGPLATIGAEAASRALGGDLAAGRSAIAEHLGVCVDTCHLSLAFVDPADAVRRMVAAGARIAKVQVSAAPEVISPGQDPSGVAAMRALDEPRFLHQTAAARRQGEAWGTMVKVQDLGELDRLLERIPDAHAVRSHFHVPLTTPVTGHGLSATIAGSRAGLAASIAAGCTHVAAETYTWPLLARSADTIRAGTAGELRWLAEQLA
ncbi:sugar phosphate isomerase [Planctomycetota bacterium]|nr:sugar phosphate isomerase [Planctomycetota bacterium]